RRFQKGTQIGSFKLVNRRWDGNDKGIVFTQILFIGSKMKPYFLLPAFLRLNCRFQRLYVRLLRAVFSLTQFVDTVLINVKAKHIVFFAKLNGKRKPYITQSNHGYAGVWYGFIVHEIS